MIAAAVKDLIDKAPLSVHRVGLRVEDGRTFRVGEYLPDSRRWVDGEPTDETEDGVCTVGVDLDAKDIDSQIQQALDRLQSYHGGTIVVVGGRYVTYGQDDGEYIIRPGICLGCLARQPR